MFTIQKNIPLPAKVTRSKKGKSKYPFADMKIGDSFFVPKTAKGNLIYTATQGLPIAKRKNYTCRTAFSNTGVQVVRYWRVK